MACDELPELKEARLKVKAMRSFVRDLDASLARAEEALDQARLCKCNDHPQPIGGTGNDRYNHLTAA